MAYPLSERLDHGEVDDDEGKQEGKFGTETLNRIGEWFSNTEYGKRFNAGVEREAALKQSIIDQGGIGAFYLKLENKPNELEQRLLEGISDVTNIDERITTPATYFAVSGGLRGLSKLKPKHLGISQSISKIKTLPEPTVTRSLTNVTPGQSIFSIPVPKVKGTPSRVALPQSTGGIKVQTEKGMLYRTETVLTSQFASTLNAGALDGKLNIPKASVEELGERLEAFKDKHLLNLETTPLTKINTAKGMVEGKLFPGTKEELLSAAKEYIDIREAIHEGLVERGVPKNKTGFYNPRSGWQKFLGNWIDDKGVPMRLSGGMKSSGGRPLSLQKQGSQIDRVEGLRLLKGDLKQEGLRRMWPRKHLNLEGHHMETAAKEADIFTRQIQPDGSIGRRSPKDIAIIEDELAKFNMQLGDKATNLGGLTPLAHTGKGGVTPAEKMLPAHETPKTAYDFEGLRDWAWESEQIRFEIPTKDGIKTVLLDNKEGILYERARGELPGRALGDIDDLKAGRTPGMKFNDPDNLLREFKGAKAVEFKIGGKSYLPGQKTGLSLEAQKYIAQIKDPALVVEAVKLYYFAGIPAKRAGTSALAYYTLHRADPMGGPGGIPTDPKSVELFRSKRGEMLEVIDDLKKYPGFNNVPEFKRVAESFESIQREISNDRP